VHLLDVSLSAGLLKRPCFPLSYNPRSETGSGLVLQAPFWGYESSSRQERKIAGRLIRNAEV